MDYTPGIFQITMDYYDANKKDRVHTTLAKQLALYVTMYSPLQMAADLRRITNASRMPSNSSKMCRWTGTIRACWKPSLVIM